MTSPAAPDPVPGDPVLGDSAPVQNPRPMPTSQPVLLRAFRWGIVSTVALMLVFAGIGILVAGMPGLVGGLIGAGLGGVFLTLTVGSIAFANRFVESDMYIVAFFGIVLGSWVLKFLVFILALFLLRDQPWLDTRILAFGVIASVIVSLAIDVLVIAKARIPVVSLPE